MALSGEVSVLCVDDEAPLVELTATFLERVDDRLATRTATGADDALDCLDAAPVDCIVSDYDMPGVDGLAFLEAVRADRPELPFVLFTGKGSEEIASEAISAGVTDYMQKRTGTSHYDVLARRVCNAVERYRARREAVEASERARTILEASPDAIVVSVGGEYVYANPSARELFGADAERGLVGMAVSDVVHPAERGAVAAALTGTDPGEYSVNQVRRTLQTLDGRTFPAEVTGRGIRWEGEDAVVAIIRDVSQRSLFGGDLRTERAALRDLHRRTVAETDDVTERVGALVDLGRERVGLPSGYLVREDGTTVLARGPEEDVDDDAPTERCEHTDEEGRTLARTDGEGAYLGAPVRMNGARAGTLCFTDPTGREEAFSYPERAFVELLAQWVGFEGEHAGLTDF